MSETPISGSERIVASKKDLLPTFLPVRRYH